MRVGGRRRRLYHRIRKNAVGRVNCVPVSGGPGVDGPCAVSRVYCAGPGSDPCGMANALGMGAQQVVQEFTPRRYRGGGGPGLGGDDLSPDKPGDVAALASRRCSLPRQFYPALAAAAFVLQRARLGIPAGILGIWRAGAVELVVGAARKAAPGVST